MGIKIHVLTCSLLFCQRGSNRRSLERERLLFSKLWQAFGGVQVGQAYRIPRLSLFIVFACYYASVWAGSCGLALTCYDQAFWAVQGLVRMCFGPVILVVCQILLLQGWLMLYRCQQGFGEPQPRLGSGTPQWAPLLFTVGVVSFKPYQAQLIPEMIFQDNICIKLPYLCPFDLFSLVSL